MDKTKLTQATFTIPGPNPEQDELEYNGYHFPNEHWNGFAVPEFELSVAEKILSESGYNFRVEAGELFATLDEEYGEEEIPSTIRTIGEKQIVTYGVGARYWVWSVKRNKKKAYVLVTTRLIILMEEDVEVSDVIQDMDYNFTASDSQNAIITDTEIRDFKEFNPDKP